MTVDTWIDVVVNVPSNKLPELNIKEFGRNLKEVRIRQGYPRKRVAKILGISEKSLQAYEEGNRIMNVAAFYKLIILFPEITNICENFARICIK